MTLLKKRLNDVQKSISNILSAIEHGIFTSSTKECLEELESQKKELEIEIAQESIARPMLDRDQIKFWFHRFRKMDVTLFENRRRLVDSFVNSIILHDDRIEFYFNFKKGAKTLSLTDLEKSSETLDTLPPNKRDTFRVSFLFAKKYLFLVIIAKSNLPLYLNDVIIFWIYDDLYIVILCIKFMYKEIVIYAEN